MSAVSVRLPNSLHAKLREYASRDNASINQFVALAVAEKIGRLGAEVLFQEGSARGVGREEYLRLLAKAPGVQPENPEDRME
jgi:hypothetical protein